MKKMLLLACIIAFSLTQASAQNVKPIPPQTGQQPAPEQLRMKPWHSEKLTVPPGENPFGLSRADYRPRGPLALPSQPMTADIETEHGENGLPVFFHGRTPASESTDPSLPIGLRALAYAASLQPAGLQQPADEFAVFSSHQDEQGNWHVRLNQVFKGVPVYGGQVVAHTKNLAFESLNGRYYPTPRLASVVPGMDAETALQRVKEKLGAVKTAWSAEERLLVGGKELQTELVVYHPRRDLEAERLAWHIVVYPNLLSRKVFFVDAVTGEIIHHFDHTCSIGNAGSCQNHENDGQAPAAGGPVTASGLDLKNVSRSFGAWMEGTTNYLIDAGQPMFNLGASQMPDEPVGGIMTLDAQNTSPEVQTSFKFGHITSGSLIFGNKNAVSAHWNAVQSYNYFLSVHGRNSINGNGGNIISLINVSESDGTSMGNAFWNGGAIWYGNGGTEFFELARSLDVSSHEMTHGVIEKTANLEYQDESGALNESFADIFAVCIDTLNWKLGEDIVRPGTTTNNCLRDIQFPKNGTPQQPDHYSDKYTGPLDHGGVHINSGIVNRAFYLFASHAAVGRAKAEKVYYKALNDYLVKSSQFVDCRLAVIQAANDLYGSPVANAAADAFTAVGIVGNQGGNYFGLLNVNPGIGTFACKNNASTKAELILGSGSPLGTLFTKSGVTIASRPSATDNGQQVVFCTSDGHVIGVDIVFNNPGGFTWQSDTISFSPIWRNVAISRDGRFLAAVTKFVDNRIYVFDIPDPLGASAQFFLYNPTYSPDQITGEVQFADALEFDYSGEYIMYDAYNDLDNGLGQDLSYWDIGFLNFWENGDFAGPDPFIAKLYSGLPPNSSVVNPTFSQMAPFVIALDYYDGVDDRYHVLGANIETGEEDYIVFNNGELGWPSYIRADMELMYQRTANGTRNMYQRFVEPNRITGTGASPLLISAGRDWGRWIGHGTRSLMVNTANPAIAPLKMTAAPNPTTGNLRLTFALPQSSATQVSVSDMLGQLVRHSQQDLPEGENLLDLDLHDLPAGTYAVRVVAGGASATVKVVKQ
ncbi:MAG: M4 family metallopeptidase [Saprospiraceae bacterium]